MNRNKIIQNEPVISKEQIEKHKNFDQLLDHYYSYKSRRPSFRNYKSALGVAGLLLLAGAFWFVYSSEILLEDPRVMDKQEQESVTKIPNQVNPVAKKNQEPKKEEPGEKAADLAEKDTHLAQKQEEKSQRPLAKDVKEEKEPRKAYEKVISDDPDEEIALSYTEAVPKNGMQHLYRYFNENLRYPQEEIMAKTEGTVILSFSITPAGKAAAIEVVQKVSGGIDAEAVRLVKEMPEWTPAYVKGKAVNSRVTLPVTFQIKDSDEN